MIQRREDLRFALEPGDAVRIVGEHLREDLDRDFAPQLCVARAINLSHAAAAEGSDDLVRPDARAGLDRPCGESRNYTPLKSARPVTATDEYDVGPDPR